MVDPKTKTGEPHVDGDFDRELNYRAIVGFVVATAALAVLTFVFAWYLDGGLRSYLGSGDAEPSPLVAAADRPVPPLPHLQTLPYQDLIDMRAEEDAVLHSYAWTDREKQKIRIPIDEAIQRVAKNGLPQWPAVDPAAEN